MTSKPSSCSSCPLYEKGQGFMSPEGSGTNGVMIVLEALGVNEAADSLPVRPNAPAGAIFQGLLRRMAGVERNHFTITNSVWCRPPNNWLDGAPYEYAALEACQQYNKRLVESRRPRAILAMGAIPARTITGMHGYHQGIKLIRGYQLFSNRPEFYVDGKPLPVVATYHPSFMLRASKTRSKDDGAGTPLGKVEKAEGGMALSGVVIRDIQLAISLAKNGPMEKPKMETIKGNRDVMDWLIKEYASHPEWPLYWDIETPRSRDKADDESEIDSIQAQVTQIQFGHNKERGFVFPGFDAEYVKNGTAKLLGQRNRRMLTWNGWKFDDKVVQGHHHIPILGINIDLMSAWSWLQPDLPKGLQFATSFHAPEIGPWKHLVFDSEDIYGMYDVVSLAYNDESIFQALEKRGLINSYNRHVLKLRDEMVLASHRGFPVDKEMHDEFGSSVKAEIDTIAETVRGIVPEDILNVEPRRKPKGSNVPEFGYVLTPKQILPWLDDNGNPKDDGDRVILREEVPVEDDDGGDDEDDTTEPDTSNGDASMEARTEIRSVVYVRRSVEVFDKKTLETNRADRWCRLKPFSLGSPQQKIKYIQFRRAEEIAARMAGKSLSWDEKGNRKSSTIKPQILKEAERLAKYVVPKVKNKMKELKENTGAKEIDKLSKSTGDPMFKLWIEVAKYKKLYGTYYKGWTIVDGGVHTTFGLADTSTGQITSKDPNVQNAIKHGKLAAKFRKCIKALPGKVLIEIDKKSFHAQTLALEAKDHVYARLSAIDVHSFMTAHRLKFPEARDLLSWSDADLSAWFEERKADTKTIYKSEAVPNIPDGLNFKQVRDYKSKKVILGIGFCQGAGSIFDQNPEGYKDKKEVQGFLDLFGDLFNKVRLFQGEVTKLANKQTYLQSRWGYIRRFYDVFQWDPRKWNQVTGCAGDWAHGDDYEAAVAFLPANDAFGMIKEEMLRMAGYRLDPNGMVNIPDELLPILESYIKTWSRADYDLSKDGPDTTAFWNAYLKSDKMIPWKCGEDLFERYGFVNQVHDSVIFHCDKSLADQCIHDCLGIMREKCTVLKDPEMCPDGFFVDAEAMIGPDWKNMETVHGV